jgi:SAM-dependent methyltransferase
MSELAKDRTILQRLAGYRDIFFYHSGKTKEYAEHDYDVYRKLNNNISKYIATDDAKLKVLDIGCGQRYPNTLLFANRDDCEAVGVDSDVVGPGIGKYFKMIVKNGLERTVKSAIRETLFDRVYFKTLEQAAGQKLSKRNLKIVNFNSSRLPFDDDYFDLIISNAVFEHIDDVPAALAELVRICKPKGLMYNLIHLYTSLSGGHNLRWANPEDSIPDDIPPWDHLRGNEFPTHIYLNKLRERDYRKYFATHTEILEWQDGVYEGQQLLTPQIKAELDDYDERELLMRDFTVISRPLK